MERFCQSCGAAVSEKAKFCRKCGSKLEISEEKCFCEECGAELPPDSDFCEECGTRVDKAADSGAVTTDAWVTDSDPWGDTLTSLTAREEEAKLATFEYEKRPDGTIIIKGLRDKYAVNLEIPEGVTVIGDSAFAKTKILSVKLPEGLTTIDRRAFYECELLREINIPSTVIIVGDEAFYYCKELEVTLPETVVHVGCGALRCTKTDLLARAAADRKREEMLRLSIEEGKRLKAEREAKEREEAEAEAKKRAKEEEKRLKDDAYKRAHASAWASQLAANATDNTLSSIYNDPLAVEWLTEKSSGDFIAAIVLAKCYLLGYGTKVNKKEAAAILQRIRRSPYALEAVQNTARWLVDLFSLHAY